MKQDTLINIYVKGTTGHADEYGIWVPDETIVTSTYCLIEPYSQEKAKYKYGVDVETNRRVFIDHEEPLIKVGMIMRTDTKEYEIKAIPWDYRHIELLVLAKDSVA